jgi:hypothetical protein
MKPTVICPADLAALAGGVRTVALESVRVLAAQERRAA